MEDGLSDVLLDVGAGYIAFCPLAQGLLTSRYLSGIEEGSRASNPNGFLKSDHVAEEKIQSVRALTEIAAN